jgi:hypothetical protein
MFAGEIFMTQPPIGEDAAGDEFNYSVEEAKAISLSSQAGGEDSASEL